MSLQEFLTWLKELVEASAPALAVLLWDYKQEELDESKNDTLKAQTALEIEKNHEKIDEQYSGKSDANILGLNGDSTVAGSSPTSPAQVPGTPKGDGNPNDT